MTTDITELAQSEINDALAQLKQISEYPTPSTQYARVLRKYILALVEALEKAQQVDEELCKLLPPGAEYMDPPDGGDVTPLEQVSRMVADYRQRISMLESKIVIVSLPSINPEMFNQDVVFGYQKAQKEAVEFCAAAGIKLQVGK
ncbi:TPA: hypothetical protein MIL20_003495 [Klebsiella pneumoniae]|uniref:hypothetical protein n=1 Tax=Klebsiella pneumoniae TaxID=573 RepID=UPI000EF9840F|nr:hypothetical protein [Klebsiella pneumoniae]RLZ87278.1 hypothetical protein EA160_16525 [Klebsiella pneumoniae]HBX9866896.1 hypothetical protein [Klebsiella pneumoniae]HCB2717453.1 hypothetical protein [Klebsiella pneumoniae]HCC6119767.1 hypothetical protein [Klebsiella pneumoniae]HCM1783494.1 hypothetical protein [Klebsiella pneumoniae]